MKNPWLDDLPEEWENDQRHCFLGGGGGGSQPAGNTTTVQKSDPWSKQEPYLLQAFRQSQGLAFGTPTFDEAAYLAANPDVAQAVASGEMESGASHFMKHGKTEGRQPFLTQGSTPQYFPGQTYATPTSAMDQALQMQMAQAQGGNPLTGAATQSALNRFSPEYLSSNPGNAIYQDMASGDGMQSAINNAVARATPGLLDTFTQGNRLNSPGAAYAVSQGITDAAAPYVMAAKESAAKGISENYNTAGQQQNQAMLVAPQLQGMPYADIAQLYGAGATQQGLQQNVINDAMARYNYDETLPYNLQDWYNASIGGSFGGTSSLSSPYFAPQTGGIGSTLGGAASGAMLGSYFGPWGAAGGGILGALFS